MHELIGRKVKLYGQMARVGSPTATIVDFLPKGEVPDAAKIRKYYRIEADESAMKSVFKPSKMDRIILQREGASTYIVMPDTRMNASYWELVQ